MPDNHTTALVKASQSPALSRVSNQLTLTNKLLAKPNEPLLIPYRKKSGYTTDPYGCGSNNYWAFCNEDGQIIFEKFCGVNPFIEGLAIVSDFRRAPKGLYDDPDETCYYYGFLDETGKLAIPYKFYSSVSPFVEGLSMVTDYDRNGNSGMFGFIDRNGQEVVPCIYRGAFDFSGGLSAVGMDKYFDYGEWGYDLRAWGFIDVLGNIIVDTKYHEVQSFSEGLAAVCHNWNSWGFIDTSGKVIISLVYLDAKPFDESLAAVEKDTSLPDFDEPTSHWGFIDKIGNVIIDFIYDDVKSFSECLAAVKKGNKWGFINNFGINIVDFLYDDVNSFSEKIASVKKDEKWTFIDINGVVISSHFYDEALQYSQGRCGVRLNEKWGFVDQKGEVVIEIKYDKIKPFSNKISQVYTDWNFAFGWKYDGYINRYGREYWDK